MVLNKSRKHSSVPDCAHVCVCLKYPTVQTVYHNGHMESPFLCYEKLQCEP